jgi:dCTP deaminase
MILSRPDLQSLVDGGAVTRTDGQDVVVDLVSVGLHLDSQFSAYPPHQAGTPPFDAHTEIVPTDPDGSILFPPGAALLACSVEIISMPLDTMGFIQTKGSLARGFIMAHMCDGQIDPGYCGKVTLELVNLGNVTYRLTYGMAIAQLFIMRLASKLDHGYDGRYQDSAGPTSMKAPK